MKTSKFTLVAILALSGFMACNTVVRAEDAPKAPDAPAADAPAAPKNKGGKPGGPMMELLQKLNLTSEQMEKVMPVLKEQREKITALRQDQSLSREDKMAKMKGIAESVKEQLKAILTPEQFAKFEEEAKNLRGPGGPGGPGGAGHRPKGDGNGAAPAPAPAPGSDK